MKYLQNLEYRTEILKACMLFQTAMSYYITANKGIPHGIACSFTLPMLIDNAIGEYKFIDDALEEIFGEPNSLRENWLFLQSLMIMVSIKKNLKSSLKSNQRAGNSLVNI